MATTLYDLTIPVFVRGLTALSGLLDKGAAYAAEQGIDPATLTGAQLIADMKPLTAQVQFACDTAKGTVTRLGELEPVAMPDDEQTFAQLQARIAKTIALLEAVPRETIDGREDATVVLKIPGGEIPFTGRSHVQTFSLPNFYFHLTITYALLRQAGVPVGKMDFLGGV
ncbi:DUF1993 domain-containing protein [Sphingobium sp. AR-3-1]|uniref:DUF1993 domain-containing protein n=1 Tax=Sphingobium psychrophilum TaxID=2728834 RepID=A0A7X9ZUP1_9SPHN|nr:DUF1993 domain-containing protein [Sphingobium psychrophilum]NML11816.1 DUF1993 domain-containing protein [Sphingobium psychrophilum]